MSATNKVWYVMLTSSVIANGIIAWGLADTLPILNPSPTQRFLRQFVPDEFWPIIFGVCSISAIIGIWNTTAVRFHFGLAGTIMMIWGLLGIFLSTTPITWAGGFLLVHMAILKLSLMWYAPRLIQTHKSTKRLLNELDSATADLKECPRSGDTTRYSQSS